MNYLLDEMKFQADRLNNVDSLRAWSSLEPIPEEMEDNSGTIKCEVCKRLLIGCNCSIVGDGTAS